MTKTNQFSTLPVLLTMGDPRGIGPEISFKAWQFFVKHNHSQPPIYFCILGEDRFFYETADQLGFIPPVKIHDLSECPSAFTKGLPILPLSEIQQAVGIESMIIDSIKQASLLVYQKKALALVTNPIHKAKLYQAGFLFPGHTEYIAHILDQQTHPKRKTLPVMMLATPALKPTLRIALVSIHIPLKNIFDHIRKETLESVIKITHQALKIDFNIANPRLVIAGLNPHAGENGKLGNEEQTLINPVAEALRKQGIQITNACSADSLFHEQARQHYECAICLYHDQGLIPVKTLDFWRGVNITLGIPIIRTSPDHGVAYDQAGKNLARANSLIQSIKTAVFLAQNRLKHERNDHASK